MDFRIIFDRDNYTLVDDGATARSIIIYIPIGHSALLSLYNMTNNITLDQKGGESMLTNKSCLTLKKVSFGPVDETEIKLICGQYTNVNEELEKLLHKRRRFSEAVYQDCCPWAINPGNNFVLIPTPGFYELETSELDQLDNIYVESALLTAEQALIIPEQFKLGG